MDWNFNLDATCLSENVSDRNVVVMLVGLDQFKIISSLTHNKQERFWTWQFQDPEAFANNWNRSVECFPVFKKWALSFGHAAMHRLVCTLEDRLNG
jgi:hypothetical protein